MYFPLKLDRHYSDYVVRLGLFEVMRLCSRSLHLRWLHFSVASCARHNTNPQSAILVGQFVIFNDVWNCNNWHESNQFTTVRLRQLRVRKMSFYIDIAVIYVFNTQHFIMYFGMSIDKSELLPMLDMMLAENYYTIIMWRWKKIEVCLWKMQLAVMNSLVFLSSLF